MHATYTREQLQAAIDRARAEGGSRRVRPTAAAGAWFVNGRSAIYTVRELRGELYCSCPARALCWHQAAVWMWQLGRRAMRPSAWGRDLQAEAAAARPAYYGEADYLDTAPSQAELLGLRKGA